MKRVRPKPQQLWDDKAFRVRLADMARRKGLTVSALMEAVGLTREYNYRGSDARSTNDLMVLAEYLGVSPAELAGWTAPGRSDGLGRLIAVLDTGLSSMLEELRAVGAPKHD